MRSYYNNIREEILYINNFNKKYISIKLIKKPKKFIVPKYRISTLEIINNIFLRPNTNFL